MTATASSRNSLGIVLSTLGSKRYGAGSRDGPRGTAGVSANEVEAITTRAARAREYRRMECLQAGEYDPVHCVGDTERGQGNNRDLTGESGGWEGPARPSPRRWAGLTRWSR